MNLAIILILFLSTTLTAIISGVVGMGGGITLLSIMTFFLNFEIIVPIHGVVQLASNSGRTFFLKNFIHKKICQWFFLGAPIGTLIAYKLIVEIKNKELFLFPLTMIIFYTLFKPKKLPEIKLPYKGYFFLGIMTGFMGPLIGATGPLLAPFFLRSDLTKEQIVSTKALTQTFTHLLKLPLFFALDFDYFANIYLILAMITGAILGTKLGVHLLKRVEEKTFKLVYQFALLISGIRLLYKIFLV